MGSGVTLGPPFRSEIENKNRSLNEGDATLIPWTAATYIVTRPPSPPSK